MALLLYNVFVKKIKTKESLALFTHYFIAKQFINKAFKIMKKFICAVALASICLGAIAAPLPVKSVPDTTKKAKTKVKKHKIKRKVKDSTGNSH